MRIPSSCIRGHELVNHELSHRANGELFDESLKSQDGSVVRRNVSGLANKEFDLVIVGGGVFGICAAWDAILRGLSVALVERKDFAHATSANCFKIVHGGIRYLQHADVVRIRESSKERSAFLRIAPHLVKPLPIVIPTYGHGVKGKEILGLGLGLYDLITWDRNHGISDSERQIPRGHFISRQEALELFPGLGRDGLTGAAIMYDGQMYSPARLALSFLRSAVEGGAEAANYIEATGFLRSGAGVTGIQAKDALTGEQFHIRGRVVLNAAGPWAERLLELRLGLALAPKGTYSRDAFFVVPRALSETHALAINARTMDPDAILSRKTRHLFLVPWRGSTLVGVWHVVHQSSPDDFTVTEDDLRTFIDEVNDAYPAFGLTLDDVSLWHAGLVLFGENTAGSVHLSYGKRSRIVDHQKEHGIDGLVTLVGVRYTTARREASRAIDVIVRKLGKACRKCVTDVTPIYGGHIERFEEFLNQVIERRPSELSAEVMRNLAHNHGSEYGRVLKYLDENPMWAETLGSSSVIKAEVLHAVRMEMAQKLGDVVFRRTDLGTGGFPGNDALRTCADLMAAELGWGESRVRQELEEVTSAFPRHPSTAPSNAGTHRHAVAL